MIYQIVLENVFWFISLNFFENMISLLFRDIHYISLFVSTYLSKAKTTVMQTDAVMVIFTAGYIPCGYSMVQLTVQSPKALTKLYSVINNTQKIRSTDDNATINRLKLFLASFLLFKKDCTTIESSGIFDFQLNGVNIIQASKLPYEYIDAEYVCQYRKRAQNC